MTQYYKNSENSKRIAKNTILLYVRMLVTMLVGLFTSRVVLDALGVEDFGIYNVVGGFVSMFVIVRAGLVSSTQRFLTFDLGKGDIKKLNQTFSTITLIYVILCAMVLIVAEIGGVWFIEHKLVIPSERLYAAQWVFQFSLLTLIVTLLSSAYNSLIIAHEKMKAFAYITIYEVFAKLLVAYILYITSADKLIVYAILLCIVQVTVPILYWYYCQRNFREEVKLCWHLKWEKVREIYSFAGWAMLGGIANIGYTQGLNMLLGMFFTPMVNAARGVAVQVQGLISQFVTNFQMAVDPQIIKSYAREDYKYMSKLISTSSRFSYFLMYFISLPVFLEAETLLGWWLVEVPQYTPLFFRLIIITTMYDAISNPYGKAIQATGDIRKYQLICSTVLILIVPIAYITLKLGAPAYSVFIVHIILGFIAMICRINMGRQVSCESKQMVVKYTALPILLVTITSFVIPYIVHIMIEHEVLRFFMTGLCSVISVGICIFLFGLSKEEQFLIKTKICKLKK